MSLAPGGIALLLTDPAETIAKALRADRPRTRYVAGQYARPLLLLRRLLSDRMFDRLIAGMLR